MAGQDLGYRRIQLTGRDSYVVSLPKKWMLTVGLGKGDELAFRLQDNTALLVVPRKVLEKQAATGVVLKEFTVPTTPKDDPQSITRRLMSLYTVGADLIHIRFKEITTKQRTSIKSTVRMMLGSEIVSESSNEINVQILVRHPEFPIEQAVRRMFVIATSLDREAVTALKDLDEVLLQGVLSSDDDLDRLSLYVVRQLKHGVEHNLFREMGFESPREFLGYRIVTKDLENIGDNAVGTAKNILALKELVNNQIITMAQPIDEEVNASVLEFHSFGHRILEDSFNALVKRHYHLADQTISLFMSTGLQLEKDAVNIMLNKRMDPNVASVLRLILDNSRKMMEYGRDIAEVTLNRTVEESLNPQSQ